MRASARFSWYVVRMRAGVAGVVLALVSGLAPAGAGAAEAVSPTPAPPTATAPANVAPSTHDVHMNALKTEVDGIKQRIVNSKARPLLLQSTVLHGAAAGAVARIHFKNEIGSAYRLDAATWVLDGQTIAAESSGDPVAARPGPVAPGAPPRPGLLIQTPEQIAAEKDRDVFDGAIVPGNHTLSVTLIYRGNGYQLFNYLEGYRFTVQSTYSFVAEEGKTTELSVMAVPKDSLSHSYEDRLDMRFQVSTKDSVPIAPAEAKP